MVLARDGAGGAEADTKFRFGGCLDREFGCSGNSGTLFSAKTDHTGSTEGEEGVFVVRSGLGASEEAFGGVRGAEGVRDKAHGHGDRLFELEIVLWWQVIGQASNYCTDAVVERLDEAFHALNVLLRG